MAGMGRVVQVLQNLSGDKWPGGNTDEESRVHGGTYWRKDL